MLYKPILKLSGSGNGSHILSPSFTKNVLAKARLIVTPKYFFPFFLMEKRDTTTADIEIASAITEIAPGTMLITMANKARAVKFSDFHAPYDDQNLTVSEESGNGAIHLLLQES